MPRFDVRPFDRHECQGCGQLLDFDAQGFVSDDALAACESRCDWVLVQRRADRPVPPDGAVNPPWFPATAL